jgi:hypothetical protein
MHAMNTHEAVTWIADALERPAPDISAMPPALCPRDLPTGHALQDPLTALLASRGRGATIGWKVDSTTPAIELVGAPAATLPPQVRP